MQMKTTKDKSKNEGSTITYQIFQDIRYDRSHKNLSKQKKIGMLKQTLSKKHKSLHTQTSLIYKHNFYFIVFVIGRGKKCIYEQKTLNLAQSVYEPA